MSLILGEQTPCKLVIGLTVQIPGLLLLLDEFDKKVIGMT